jgi:hypothetical protein
MMMQAIQFGVNDLGNSINNVASPDLIDEAKKPLTPQMDSVLGIAKFREACYGARVDGDEVVFSKKGNGRTYKEVGRFNTSSGDWYMLAEIIKNMELRHLNALAKAALEDRYLKIK